MKKACNKLRLKCAKNKVTTTLLFPSFNVKPKLYGLVLLLENFFFSHFQNNPKLPCKLVSIFFGNHLGEYFECFTCCGLVKILTHNIIPRVTSSPFSDFFLPDNFSSTIYFGLVPFFLPTFIFI